MTSFALLLNSFMEDGGRDFGGGMPPKRPGKGIESTLE